MNRILREPSSRQTIFAVTALIFSGMGYPAAVLAQTDARKIMEGVYSQDTSHDATLKAVFDIYDKDGKKQEKKVTVLRLGSPGDSKTLVRFTDPVAMRGVALLSINKSGEKDRQWLYIPATKRARSVSPRDRSEKFAGTDFTYEDLTDRITEGFDYRVLSEEETIDGHKTYKIEATPRDPGDSQYKAIYYWIGQDVPCILFAELYDSSGKKIRTLHATQVKKASGIWGMRHVEMTSVGDNTRTVLTVNSAAFNKGLEASQFTPEALEKAN
jgi:outer membrane lipoprotein-sorting protein